MAVFQNQEPESANPCSRILKINTQDLLPLSQTTYGNYTQTQSHFCLRASVYMKHNLLTPFSFPENGLFIYKAFNILGRHNQLCLLTFISKYSRHKKDMRNNMSNTMHILGNSSVKCKFSFNGNSNSDNSCHHTG